MVEVEGKSKPRSPIFDCIKNSSVASIGFILLVVGITLLTNHAQCELTECRINTRYECNTGSIGATAVKSTTQSCSRYQEKAWTCSLKDITCIVVWTKNQQGKKEVATNNNPTILTAATVLHPRVQTGEGKAMCAVGFDTVDKYCQALWPHNTTANVFEYDDADDRYIPKYQLGLADNIANEGAITVLIFGSILLALGLLVCCVTWSSPSVPIKKNPRIEIQ